MRKGFVLVKKVVVILICMAIVIDSQMVRVIAAETAGILLEDDKEFEVEREAEDNLIEEDTLVETDQKSINDFDDVLLVNDDTYFDSLSNNSADDAETENIEEIKNFVEDGNYFLDNESLILNDSNSAIKVNSISLGDEHSAAIDEDDQLWTWGWNGYGQLGYGNVTTSSTPKKVLEKVKVKKVNLGNCHSAAIDENGQLWIWGRNEYGQLGDGTTKDSSTPKKVLEKVKVKEVSLGLRHSAAIDENGQLWTWGDDSDGQLGDWTLGYRSTPKKVLEKVKVKEVSLGEYHSAAIDEDGQLWTWGANSSGQLGDGTKADSRYPKKVLEKVKVKEVSLGEYHSAAIDENGKLWTWGDNSNGQLGDGTIEDSFTPKKVKVLEKVKVKEVSLGRYHSAAIDENGKLWTWGDNSSGQLGDGTIEDSSTPKKVKELENVNVEKVSLGEEHSAAIDVSGLLWTWGANRCGQLGDGTKKDKNLPKKNPYFTEVSYTIIFDSCGGSTVESQKVKRNEEVIKPSDPIKGDLSFVGWYKDKEYNEQYNFDTPVKSSFTLYAKWTSEPETDDIYTIIFDSCGGSTVESQKIKKNEEVIKPSNPTKGDSSFIGWYKDKEYNELYNFDTPVTSSFTLYAKWTSKTETDGITTTIDYATGSTQVKLNSRMFSEPSTKRNYDLMLLSAVLSAAAEGEGNGSDGKKICDAYDNLKMNSDYALFSYPDNDKNVDNIGIIAKTDDNLLAFSIAHKTISINGAETNIIFLVARGSKDIQEFIFDGLTGSGKRAEFGDNEVYDYPYDFSNDMLLGLYYYTRVHPELNAENSKIIITGHSLGGAAANLVAARLTSASDFSKDDIYCYTFGAIDSIKETVSTGYENIHNVFNMFDTFGPFDYGRIDWYGGGTAAGNSALGKFGHMELFAHDYLNGINRDGTDTTNHNIESYIKAIESQKSSKPEKIEWHCLGEKNQPYGYMLYVKCPVNVEIENNGEIIGRVKDDVVDQSVTKIPILVRDSHKFIVLPNDASYKINVIATDSGTMEYCVSRFSDLRVLKEFSDISLTKGKIFSSELGNSASSTDVKLYVEDGKGEKIAEVISDGTEIKSKEYSDIIPEDIPKDGIIPEAIWIAGVKDKEYTGSKVKQSFRVYDGTTLLNEKVDYTVACKNDVNVYTLAEGDRGFDPKKAPSITVTGKGNYDSKEVVYFKILPLDISGADFTADDITLPATGKKQTVKPALYWKDKALKNKTDYKFAIYKASDTSYSNPLGDSVTEAGDYMVRFTGNGNFTGTRDTNLKLTSEGTLVSKLKVGKIAAAAYSGKEIKPEPEVYDGKTLIEKGKHYTLSYASNVDPGTGYVIITGIPENGYAGSRRVSFKINAPKSAKAGAYDISEAKDTEKRITVTCSEEVFFMKGGAKPAVTVMYKDAENKVIRLIEGRDYKIAFKNNTAVGGKKTPLAVISGTGNFKGKREIPFSIKVKSLDKVTLLADDVPFKNKANSFISKITITDEDDKNLSSGKDYEKEIAYTYVNDTEVTTNVAKILRKAGDAVDKQDIIPADTVIRVTATAEAGSGYTGTVSGTYRIVTANISSAKVTIPAQVYTGKPITPTKKDISVVVKGTRLSEDEYEIEGYSNNINKGTAKVTIRGTGNYGGLKTESFKIKAKGFTWWWRK